MPAARVGRDEEGRADAGNLAEAQQLAEENIGWARAIGLRLARTMPPQFDQSDFESAAIHGLWKAALKYRVRWDQDKYKHPVPFKAFARIYVRSECLMSVRRKNWTDGDHDELPADLPAETETDRYLAIKGDKLRECVGLLLPRERYLVIRHVIQGVTLPDVARELQMGLTRTCQLKAMAMKALRDMLYVRGVLQVEDALVDDLGRSIAAREADHADWWVKGISKPGGKRKQWVRRKRQAMRLV